MPTLYHASHNLNLREIEPQPTISNDKHIGNYVFATERLLLAVMYLAPKGLDILLSIKVSPPRLIVCGTEAEYLERDGSCVIYTLSDTTFRNSPQTVLTEYEKVSSVSVEPLSEEVYGSSLKALQQHHVSIYFVNREVFETIISEKNESDIIKNLKPFVYTSK